VPYSWHVLLEALKGGFQDLNIILDPKIDKINAHNRKRSLMDFAWGERQAKHFPTSPDFWKNKIMNFRSIF
jgi:hypothetical protein